MSNVQKFNENLFTELSLMTLSDYEKEYPRSSKEPLKTDNENQKEKPFYISRGALLKGNQETKVIVNTNTAISSFFMEFNGFKIRQRPSDGYIHATDMCKVGKKDWFAYKTNKITRKFIKQLSADIKKPISDLIQSIIKGKNDERGTWIHPRISINLAQWISSDFAVKVTEWVMEWSEYNDKNKQELLYSLSNLKPDEAHENKEKLIQLKLHEELGGEIEVEYEGDFIDLLTDTEIIEIKKALKWKHALGQLLVYSDGFPNHKKRLHLFEKDDVDYKRIKRHCDNFNVKVTYE